MFGIVCLALGQASMADLRPIDFEGTLCHPRNLLVKISDTSRALELEHAGVSLKKVYPEIDWAWVECAPNSLGVSRARLSALPGVLKVALDRCALPAYVPNDPLWANMWHAVAIKADKAWDLQKGNKEVVVAIIDTGVKLNHEDLAGNRWRNVGETAGNGIDDDGNGYIDDVYGYDFAYNDATPDDVHGHGTACAGLAAGIQDNAKGACGVAPKCRWMALKAATDAGWFYDTANIGAYLYAANKGAKVISGSFFSDRVSAPEEDAINYAYSHGVLPVIAAGNSNSVFPYYPGSYENVLGVGATTNGDVKAGFSNLGTWVDVSCPGTGLSTSTNSGGYTGGFGGTSGATPQVAGLAALLFSAKPTATPDEVRAAIEDTAHDITNEFTNYGLINCENAVKKITGTAFPSRTPIVRYVTPAVLSAPGTIRIYGRGFEASNFDWVKAGTSIRPIVARTRRYIDVNVPAGNSKISVSFGGTVISDFNRPTPGTNTYPLVEASTNNGGTLTGAFFDTLNYDARTMSLTANLSGDIRLDGTFMRVQPTGNTMTLRWNHMYRKAAGAVEKVYLYNWSTASFPYGSFTQVYSGVCPSTATDTLITVNNVQDLIDPDGVMYLRVEVTGAGSSAVLLMNAVNIQG